MKFNKNFLQEVSLYVDDMRILKNIYNEFIVYYNRIELRSKQCNKLLSMIIFKNIFPSDFSKLQLNRGYLYNIFQKKEKLINNRKEHLNGKITQIDQEIESLKEKYSKTDNGLAGNNVYTRADRILLLDIRKKIDEFSNEKYRKEAELKAVSKFEFRNLITRENQKCIFEDFTEKQSEETTYFESIIKSPYLGLIKYLVRNGYIDERYSEFMSYFYDRSLSIGDREFLKAVVNQEPKGYFYKIDNVSQVVSWIKSVYFKERETLNLGIMDYMLFQAENTRKKRLLLEQIKNNNNTEFIQEYIKKGYFIQKFIVELNKCWGNAINYVLDNSLIDDQVKSQYVLTTMETMEIDNIEVNLSIDPIIQYLEKHLEIIQYAFGWKNVKNILLKYNVKFDDMNQANLGESFQRFIYENNLYKLNIRNVNYWINQDNSYKKLYSAKEFAYKNYSIIQNRHRSFLARYVDENIEEYIDNLICEGVIPIRDSMLIRKIMSNVELYNKYQRYLDPMLKRHETRLVGKSIKGDGTDEGKSN